MLELLPAWKQISQTRYEHPLGWVLRQSPDGQWTLTQRNKSFTHHFTTWKMAVYYLNAHPKLENYEKDHV